MRHFLVCLSFVMIGCAVSTPNGVDSASDKVVVVNPREIWINDRVEKNEEEVFLSAMDAWEKKAKATLFKYKGRIAIGEFSLGSIYDGKSVIYKLQRPVKVGSFRVACDKNFGSCWNKTDIVICWNIMTRHYGKIGGREFLLHIKSTTTHELGHFLGLGHDEDDPLSIMSKHHSLKRKIQKSILIRFYLT